MRPENHAYVEHALALFQGDSEFCVFDLETSSKLEDPNAKVMQIAARAYRYDAATRSAKLLGELDCLVNDPTLTTINPGALAVHGIEIEMLRRSGLSPADAWRRFMLLANNRTVVGQNLISFDIPFANREMIRWGAKKEPLSEGRAIDTLLIARHLFDLPSYKLRALATYLGVPTDPAHDHDALADITTTWLVWIAMQPYLRSYNARMIAGTPNQYKFMFGRLGNAWDQDESR